MERIKRISEMLNESVNDTIGRIGLITEMSVPLKDYKRRVDGLRFQLVENWCMCKYCQMYDPNNINYSHWMRELKTCINNLKFLDIKKGASKERTLNSMLIVDYDYNSVDMISRIMVAKFRKESINDTEIRNIVCAEFANGIGDIINVISNDTITTEEYMENAFSDNTVNG